MGRHAVDLTGKVFGRLTVLKRVENARSGDAQWMCQCSCPNKTILAVTTSNLTSGNTQSCGCYHHDRITELKNDLTGKRFGRLTVIGRSLDAERSYSGRTICYTCRCDCGNECDVSYPQLVTGKTQSCGCLWLEVVKELFTKWKTPEDRSIIQHFNGMKQRCYDKNYPDYFRWGGRGIYICDEWLEDPRKFVEWSKANGYKPGLSIDRYPDNDGPYAPWNCRWCDKFAQANNTRSNVYVDIDGVRHTIAEWARLSELDYDMLYHKLRKGYDLFKDTVLFNMSLKSIPSEFEDNTNETEIN